MFYRGNDVRYQLPDDARDNTVHVLEADLDADRRVSVLAYRARFEGGASLRDMVEAQLQKDAANLPGHTLLERGDIHVDGEPAISTLCRWKGERGMVVERRAAISLGGAWLLLVVNASQEDRAVCDETMAHILRSFRARKGSYAA
jgi:hypothetical protein